MKGKENQTSACLKEADDGMSGFSDDLRKIFLAGLGAAAVTSEKAKQMVDELVKKGELTLEQGKVLNEELQRKVRTKVREAVSEDGEQSPSGAGSVLGSVEKMSPEELRTLKAKIAAVEAARRKAGGAKDDAGK